MFERFTDAARRAVVSAADMARMQGDKAIGTEHLLLAILPDPDIRRAFDRAWIGEDPVTLRPATGRRPMTRSPSAGHIPFSPRAKQTLEGAFLESHRLGQDWIGTPHLLLALLALPESSAVRTLGAAGVDLERLTVAAEEVARQPPPTADTRPASPSGRSAGDRRVRRFPGMLAEGDQPTREQYLALLEHYHGLAAQWAGLVRALDRYGRHEPSCHPEQGCTCGLQAVLDEIAGPGHDDGKDAGKDAGQDDGQRSAPDG